MNAPDYQDRVDRERAAHEEEDDVLARSYALKERFSHSTRTPAIAQMKADIDAYIEDVEGKSVLDFGCGRGEMSLQLLSHGAAVTGIDISSAYVEAARSAASAAGWSEDQFRFEVMDAHRLDFPDNQFDLVIGLGILHHLDFLRALEEVRRVLKPGGRAIFQEPLGGNPLLKLFRALTPKARTVDERPFSASDLKEMTRVWSNQSRAYGLLCAPISIATSILMPNSPDNPLLRMAWKAERAFSRRGVLDSWHQYILLNLQKV